MVRLLFHTFLVWLPSAAVILDVTLAYVSDGRYSADANTYAPHIISRGSNNRVGRRRLWVSCVLDTVVVLEDVLVDVVTKMRRAIVMISKSGLPQ